MARVSPWASAALAAFLVIGASGLMLAARSAEGMIGMGYAIYAIVFISPGAIGVLVALAIFCALRRCRLAG